MLFNATDDHVHEYHFKPFMIRQLDNGKQDVRNCLSVFLIFYMLRGPQEKRQLIQTMWHMLLLKTKGRRKVVSVPSTSLLTGDHFLSKWDHMKFSGWYCFVNVQVKAKLVIKNQSVSNLNRVANVTLVLR